MTLPKTEAKSLIRVFAGNYDQSRIDVSFVGPRCPPAACLDDEMVGLGVRVREAGRKCFTLDYAFEGRGRRT